MKRAQLIGLLVAGFAGLMAWFLVSGIVNKPTGPIVVEKELDSDKVLVARVDLGLGQVTTENDFRWQQWPKDAEMSPGFITLSAHPDAMSQFAGRLARSPLIPGEPVTTNKLVKPGAGGVLAAILPAGMRAVSTEISKKTAVGMLVLPNDRVDVILTKRIRNQQTGTDEHVSDLLFSNVRLLAVGQQIETKEGNKAAENSADTATLELTPQQAEMMALANQMGEISLALRSIADLDPATNADGNALAKPKASNAVHVLRYGVSTRIYGKN
jgi:pilus assembly protein CpaB